MDRVDVGIITIREDEFQAVLDQFPDGVARTRGQREYTIRTLSTRDGNEYRLGIVRCLGQGNLEAKGAAEDLIRDLRPGWLLVVGIAGAVPSTEFTLGDVAMSSYVYDFSVEAALAGGAREFSVSGGPLHRLAGAMAADLLSREREMVDWNTPMRVGVARPIEKYQAAKCTGDAAWKRKVKNCLEAGFGTMRPPRVTARRIAASDRLVKHPDLLRLWQTVARHAEVIEMESAGVYHAAHASQVPFLAIRGISDVIGYRRSDGWTGYACKTVAAFTRAYLETEPFQLVSPQERISPSLPREVIRALERKPYPVRLSDEVALYLRHLPKENAEEVAFRRSVEVVALFAVLTRINGPIPGNVSFLQKALIYDGRPDLGIPNETRWRVLAERGGEGHVGFPPSFGVDVLLATRGSSEGKGVSPFETLNLLWGYLRNRHASQTTLCGRPADELLNDVLSHFQAKCRDDLVRAATVPELLAALAPAFEWQCCRFASDGWSPLELSWSAERSKEIAAAYEALVSELDTLLKLQGPWSENEQRALIRESALAAIRGRYVGAPNYIRLRLAAGDRRAIMEAAEVLQMWGMGGNPHGILKLRSDIRGRLNDIPEDRRHALCQDRVGIIAQASAQELAALLDASREIVYQRGYSSREEDECIRKTLALIQGEWDKNRLSGEHGEPDETMLLAVASVAGVAVDGVDDLRREVVSLSEDLTWEKERVFMRERHPALARLIAIVGLGAHDVTMTDELYLWRLSRRLCGHCERPNQPNVPSWISIAREVARAWRGSIEVGRGILLGMDVREELVPALRNLLAATVDAPETQPGPWWIFLNAVADNVGKELQESLVRNLGYDADVAGDMIAFWRVIRAGQKFGLPFPLDPNGRFR
jgi:nucleoside phosphorylase